MTQTWQLKFVKSVNKENTLFQPGTMDLLLVLVVCEKILLYCNIQSIFAILINGYDILVAEVGSYGLSSANNTVP